VSKKPAHNIGHLLTNFMFSTRPNAVLLLPSKNGPVRKGPWLKLKLINQLILKLLKE